MINGQIISVGMLSRNVHVDSSGIDTTSGDYVPHPLGDYVPS